MVTAERHRWQFAARFRRNAFGWRSQPAIARVQEAMAEVRRVRRSNSVLAAEGAVLFLEKVSPALEHVDSSSGAIGNAVNRAIEELVPVIATAPADLARRSQWLERLWEAYTADQIPFIEALGDFWGELCASRELASVWADALLDRLRENWERRQPGDYFHGTAVCLSSLLAAGRYQELLKLLDKAPFIWWRDRRWGVQALAAMGKQAEAIAYAEASRRPNDEPGAIARVCEEILLAMGQAEESYERYAIAANQSTSYLATYRAIVRKYPEKAPAEILRDLIQGTPGEEGKWFATAKEAGLLDLAIELANRSPSDPRTLTRAARDFMEKNPAFALEAGLAALRWLGQGYGYEITRADVWTTYSRTIQVAERLGRRDEIRARVRELLPSAGVAADVLGLRTRAWRPARNLKKVIGGKQTEKPYPVFYRWSPPSPRAVNNRRRWQLNREREGEEILRHHLQGAEVQIETASDTEFAKPTVAKVLAEFLAEQQKRLSARSFSRYRHAIPTLRAEPQQPRSPGSFGSRCRTLQPAVQLRR